MEENNNKEAAVANEVNFDALAAPEGNFDADIMSTTAGTSEEEILNDSKELEGLKNIDDTIDQESSEYKPVETDLTKSMPSIEDNESVEETQTEGTNEEITSNEENNITDEQSNSIDDNKYYLKPFEQIQAKLKEAGHEFEIPEDVSEENYLDYLSQIFDRTNQMHPELLRMQDALSQGAKFEDIVNSYSNNNDLNNISDKELLKYDFAQTRKDWSADKIDEVLEKLDSSGLLEIEAGKVRTKLRNFEKQEAARQESLKKAEFEKNQQAYNEDRNKQINEALDIINNVEDVYGLPISKAEKSEFKNYFEKLVTPDDSGTAPMFKLLQSNETLVKVAAMLWKGDSKVREALTDAKELGKESIKSKLDKKPSLPNRSGSIAGDPTKVDLDALSAPERLI